MNKNYELLETFSKNNEIWAYLRHKITGFEIAFHKCETEESGFSFTFKTPVENPYLGTSHVLEHCVLKSGSKTYKIDFTELLRLACYTRFNGETDLFHTRFYFYSYFADECFKMIPIMADYLFFPELPEEAFMQECIRVEFDQNWDGRKKEISGVIYNEMKAACHENAIYGGLPYKLHELTNEKVVEYHKKYYRPDNCLFIFNGNSDLEDVLSVVDSFVVDLEKQFNPLKVVPRNHLTCKEFLDIVPFIEAPENIEDPVLAHWIIDEKEDSCCQIEGYWIDGYSPVMPFCLDDKYAYSCYCWWKEHSSEIDEPLLPPKKSAQKVMSEYLSKFSPEEYREKLEKLHKWQSRDVRNEMRSIMEPLVVKNYDIELTLSKATSEFLAKNGDSIKKGKDKHKFVEAIVKKDSFCLSFKSSEELSRKFFAEYSLVIYLKQHLNLKLRKFGILYGIDARYTPFFCFEIYSLANNKPEKTLEIVLELIKQFASYDFNETDLLMIKSEIYSRIIYSSFVENYSTENGTNYITNEIFDVTTEDLHQSAVRFKNYIEKEITF